MSTAATNAVQVTVHEVFAYSILFHTSPPPNDLERQEGWRLPGVRRQESMEWIVLRVLVRRSRAKLSCFNWESEPQRSGILGI